MRDLDDLFAALGQSKFRSRFRLRPKERAYLRQKTLPVILDHGRQFVVERLAPPAPRNDGRQTPLPKGNVPDSALPTFFGNALPACR